MTTFDVFDTKVTEAAHERRGFAAFAIAAWKRLQQRIEDRRTLRKLYHLDPHTLRDLGFEPADIYSAYENTFGEVHGDRFRGLDR